MLKKRYFTWLPIPLPLLAAWFSNFAFKFAALATDLGFAEADVTQVNNMNATVQWLLNADEAMKTNSKGLNSFREESLFLDRNDLAPINPVTAIPTPPRDMIWGIVQILEILVGKIRLADNFTDEIGVQLGINPPSKGSVLPGNVEVKGEYFPAQSGYEMAVVVTNRGEADMWILRLRIVGQEKWINAKTATGKGTSFKYEGETNGLPIQMQSSIQLMKNNETYGNPSDAVYVTLNP
ncbi:hypothetical protein BH10ACI1_BH10ACI1_07390 [soil metagenome]